MMRGGHIDICVMGAFQVSAKGDLANWSTGEEGAIPAVGGAMDLAAGAKETWVMMDLLTKKGESKLVSACTYPLTGVACVSRVYADLATLACSPDGLSLIDIVDGLSVQEALDFDIDFPSKLSLQKVVSPLRLRGMIGILSRIKRQLREKSLQ
jgi:3-oxoadipate CoA-transferase beta subunit